MLIDSRLLTYYAQILFWDWRNKKQVACLEESHMDDVTQVRFLGVMTVRV